MGVVFHSAIRTIQQNCRRMFSITIALRWQPCSKDPHADAVYLCHVKDRYQCSRGLHTLGGRRQRGLKNRIPENFEISHPCRYLCEHASCSEYIQLYLQVSVARIELRFVDRHVCGNISDLCVINPHSCYRSGAWACNLLCAGAPIICFQNHCQDFP